MEKVIELVDREGNLFAKSALFKKIAGRLDIKWSH